MPPVAKYAYPIARPWITENEIQRVSDVLRSGNLSLGPRLPEFEKKFAAYVGTRYAAAVFSGTAGLHLCMRWLDLKEGDEVITSPFSFIASANSIMFERAVPRFIDIDPKTLNMDPSRIEQAITSRTKAILVVHIFGYPADMEAIEAIARKHALPIIEDACESLGALYKGRKVGALGNPSVFGFYPNKQMTTGEGGIVATDDESCYQTIKQLANQGRAATDQWMEHTELGYNYRLSDLHCAVGIAQLERLEESLRLRRTMADTYHRLLRGIDELELLPVDLPESRSWFVYPVWFRRPLERTFCMEALIARGITCRPYLPSIHLQSFYRKRFGFRGGEFPVSEDKSARGMAIPFYIGLTEDDLGIIAREIRSVIHDQMRARSSYAKPV